MSFGDLFRRDRRLAQVRIRTCDLRSADDDAQEGVQMELIGNTPEESAYQPSLAEVAGYAARR
jgi:hypothetical protein